MGIESQTTFSLNKIGIPGHMLFSKRDIFHIEKEKQFSIFITSVDEYARLSEYIWKESYAKYWLYLHYQDTPTAVREMLFEQIKSHGDALCTF